MKIKNTLLYGSITTLILMFPVFAKSQGCVGGDSGAGVKVQGFIQPQYNFMLNGNDNNGNSLNENYFNFNRARIGVTGSIPYDVDYYFFIETSSFKTPLATPHLLDGYVSYTRFAKWAKISLGQFKSPFSLEQNTSCSGLYTINRSEFVNQLAGPQRDLGLVVTGGHDTLFVKYAVGVMNGTGMNVIDNNNNKDIVGRVVFVPFSFLQIGGSGRYSKINPTDATQKLNEQMTYGAELRLEYKNFLLQSEFIQAQTKLYSSSKLPIYGGCGGIIGFDTKQPGTYKKYGYMVMASYMTPWNLEPVIKFDSWEPDMSVGKDEVSYITGGINYNINDYARVQINYVKVMEDTPVDNDMIMIQYQAKF